MRGLVWFRSDLRIHDNLALAHAANTCDQIVALFLLETDLWHKHDVAACRIEFMLRGLKYLSEDLQTLNIPLLVLPAEKTAHTPSLILKLMEEHKIGALFVNKEYGVNEIKRDLAVESSLKKHGLKYLAYDDQVILPPGSVLNGSNSYFKIFTPYKRAWLHVFENANIRLTPALKPKGKLNIAPSQIPETLPQFVSTIAPTLWPAGENTAKTLLRKFIKHKLEDYAHARNIPSITGTSKLSPFLTSGMISPRLCFLSALQANAGELFSGSEGALTWMSELIWRDFYKHILVAVPRVSMNRAYKPETEKIHWRNSPTALKAWQQGKTGIPIIDAAMRQLNLTGWMHNRLRMIVAMFLSKNLLLDWRLGEKYFMQHLIDGDLAANNGGWQWSASTGTDAAPYFRIFDPFTQSERYDTDGTFIREYCPELAHLDDKAIHNPYQYAPLLMANNNYPRPIVDVKTTRKEAIAAFKSALIT